MKKNADRRAAGHTREFKGVVKKITGELTHDRDLEQEGRKEMLGGAARGTRRNQRLNPDPHRRG